MENVAEGPGGIVGRQVDGSVSTPLCRGSGSCPRSCHVASSRVVVHRGAGSVGALGARGQRFHPPVRDLCADPDPDPVPGHAGAPGRADAARARQAVVGTHRALASAACSSTSPTCAWAGSRVRLHPRSPPSLLLPLAYRSIRCDVKVHSKRQPAGTGEFSVQREMYPEVLPRCASKICFCTNIFELGLAQVSEHEPCA